MSSTQPKNNRWLRRFAVFSAAATLGLIGMGGLVTSHGVGMSVPDWPTSFGYNMFALPFSHWFDNFGVRYEHSHRLYASVVGLLTTILAAWIWVADSRRWLRWAGVTAFIAVVAQGVLGGLRVRLSLPDLGIFHATLGQVYLVLMAFIAFALSNTWQKLQARRAEVSFHPWLKPVVFGTTLLILGQLMIGATMRHQHAGLAVPDFPLAYGELWPRTDAAFLEEVNARRLDARDHEPITAGHIHLHMTHRVTAFTILASVIACAWLGRRSQSSSAIATSLNMWTVLVLAQAGLGAWTVWSNKAADVATGHVVLGAAVLVFGSLLSVSLLVLGSRREAVTTDPLPAAAPVMSS